MGRRSRADSSPTPTLALVLLDEQRTLALTKQGDELPQRVNQNATASSQLPSIAPLQVKHRPPRPSSDGKRGW
jgi:hypothetical protein